MSLRAKPEDIHRYHEREKDKKEIANLLAKVTALTKENELNKITIKARESAIEHYKEYVYGMDEREKEIKELTLRYNQGSTLISKLYNQISEQSQRIQFLMNENKGLRDKLSEFIVED